MSALADTMRAAGLQVTEYGKAGRPQGWAPTGVLMHHTAGSLDGDAPSLNWLINGNSKIPGPVVQILVARSGHVHLITEGRANHAGLGSGLISAGVPKDAGNKHLWGIEVESPGQSKDWTNEQWISAHTVAKILLQSMNAGSERLFRHKDYAPGRKIDTLYDLVNHRAAVDSIDIGLSPSPLPPTPPTPMPPTPAPAPVHVYKQAKQVYESKMKFGTGDSDSIWNVQLALIEKGYSIPDGPTDYFGPQTLAAVKKFQEAQGWSGNDADGIPGPETIRRLGLTWVDDVANSSGRKSNDTIAREVIRGEWGAGSQRRLRLKAAGYDYNTIQAIVNRLV